MHGVRVLVVEDHPLMQAGIKSALETCEDITIVGEAATGKRAMELVEAEAPDVVIMDVRLPDSDGITAMKDIKARLDSVKILMFSGFDDENYVIKALEGGATGFLLKNIGGKELAEAVRQAAEGMNPISPQLTSKLLPFSRRRVDASDRLTSREVEVWRILSSGASNSEISKTLYVSESTVKFHVRNIFHKLGVKNRVEAAQVAFRNTVA